MSKDVFETKQTENSEPLVSVGIMAYNRPEGLRQTLECITNQTYRNLQITVSDNCSPNPDVRKVILEYAKKDNRITMFFQPKNMGPKYNWRFVLDKSVGKYFMWAADDDYWEPEYIEEMLGLLQTNEQAVAAFCAVREKESSKITDYLDKYPNLASLDVSKRLLAFLSWKEGANIKGSILYGLHERTNILFYYNKIASHHTDKSFGPDIIMLYHLLINGPMVFSRKPLYTVTMKNIKHVGPIFEKKNIVGATFLLMMEKLVYPVWRRERFYFLVSKTMWESGASKFCFFYSLYIVVIRHFQALWAVIKYPFKKIMC